jgi:hypothetical protein
MTITVELTPDIAKVLLSRNPDNRKLTDGLVQKYAKDIIDGRWEHNGETIILSDTGQLNTGQHRCAAVILAGVPIITQMTFGVKRETRLTTDQGKKKTVAHFLKMNGLANGSNLAHAAIFIIMMEKHNKISNSPEFRPTPAEVMQWTREHPEVHEYITRSLRVGKALKVSKGLIASLWYRFSKISERDAEIFFGKLESGANLGIGDPVFRLRERLLQNALNVAKLPQSELAALTIKAWNFYRKGVRIHALSRRVKGETAESFPIPE